MSLQYAFMVKQNEKWKVGATKIQPDGSDKKEIRKRGYHTKNTIIVLAYNKTKKCMLLLLKCSLMVQTKRNQEKVVVTKICFYGSAKTE